MEFGLACQSGDAEEEEFLSEYRIGLPLKKVLMDVFLLGALQTGSWRSSHQICYSEAAQQDPCIAPDPQCLHRPMGKPAHPAEGIGCF